MYQRPIMLVPISGNGFRPSLFGSSIVQGNGFHPTLSGGYWLGQAVTPKGWYSRAKAAVAKFEQLLSRTSRIASATERDNILAWVGPTGSVDTPRERYGTVVENIGYVESFTPIDYEKYGISRLQNRVTKLESYNTEFESKVVNAETAHGRLTEPAVIERPRIVTPGVAPTGTNWTLPILVGGGALAIALAVTLIKG